MMPIMGVKRRKQLYTSERPWHCKDYTIREKIIRRKQADVFLSVCGEFMGGFEFYLLDFLILLVNRHTNHATLNTHTKRKNTKHLKYRFFKSIKKKKHKNDSFRKQRSGKVGHLTFCYKYFEHVYLLSHACWSVFTLPLLCCCLHWYSSLMLASYTKWSLCLILPRSMSGHLLISMGRRFWGEYM